ncbi:peptide ABC transporter substrate-binding protein [Sulfitobacter sp. JBTF-M27]|uniref:Peptide ABC transporter substrate-binding protein n=1 Tax=Sulfitobacter sediminilitoris TaxID=2698830 RepID=A0A6P0C8R5_9RHOB|nr:ABC transporter substrate-binding protein [Sulfitobacter sediminilitoris]NEK21585.1 peptide ABC transporter substrate-binding protein [Sulfitobacter sediminilitoris]
MSKRASLMDRRALFSSAAAAALLAATGVSAAGAPKSGGRLRIALSGGTRQDTWVKGDGLFMQVARQGMVFDTLTEVAADGTLRPELASGWQVSEDARVWSFDLRPDVSFHDGMPLTALDVVMSLQGALEGEVRATGQHRVQIMLETANAGLPLLLSDPQFIIRPAHDPEGGIGTGLYQVTGFTPGQRLLTARVAQHYKDGSAGWFDEVELTSISSEPVRGQALGEYLVDAVDVTDARSVAGLTEINVMPDARHPMQAISTDVLQPAKVSHVRPLDNLRAAERWWFA